MCMIKQRYFSCSRPIFDQFQINQYKIQVIYIHKMMIPDCPSDSLENLNYEKKLDENQQSFIEKCNIQSAFSSDENVIKNTSKEIIQQFKEIKQQMKTLAIRLNSIECPVKTYIYSVTKTYPQEQMDLKSLVTEMMRAHLKLPENGFESLDDLVSQLKESKMKKEVQEKVRNTSIKNKEKQSLVYSSQSHENNMGKKIEETRETFHQLKLKGLAKKQEIKDVQEVIGFSYTRLEMKERSLHFAEIKLISHTDCKMMLKVCTNEDQIFLASFGEKDKVQEFQISLMRYQRDQTNFMHFNLVESQK